MNTYQVAFSALRAGRLRDAASGMYSTIIEHAVCHGGISLWKVEELDRCSISPMGIS
jgi:hypothetical protein